MSKSEIDKARRKAEDSPTAWFAVLDRARETGDFQLAAKAQEALERLGVVVRFKRPRPEVPYAD